jgi:hypothetical protein
MGEFPNLETGWKNWQYKNSALLLLSMVVFFFLTRHPLINSFIVQIGDRGYPGAFVTGIFFVSSFTVAPASVVLYHLANNLNSFLVAIFAGAGAVVGDYLIFRFFKDRIIEELKPLFLRSSGKHLYKLFKTPYFAILLPVIGMVIIASPLPDEVGIGLLGASRLKNWQFITLTFLLNVIGIFLIIAAAKAF